MRFKEIDEEKEISEDQEVKPERMVDRLIEEQKKRLKELGENIPTELYQALRTVNLDIIEVMDIYGDDFLNISSTNDELYEDTKKLLSCFADKLGIERVHGKTYLQKEMNEVNPRSLIMANMAMLSMQVRLIEKLGNIQRNYGDDKEYRESTIESLNGILKIVCNTRENDKFKDEPKRSNKELISAYREAGVSQSDITEAYSTIEETKQQQRGMIIETDDKGNPIIPENWTFLVHGSSMDGWDSSILGEDFTITRNLSCVERDRAKTDFLHNGRTTADTYGDNNPFRIHVLFYKNPRKVGPTMVQKLGKDKIRSILKYYDSQEQGGRHPVVPIGTKMTYLKSSDYDEISESIGKKILWYIPEEYLEEYQEAVQEEKDKGSIESER